MADMHYVAMRQLNGQQRSAARSIFVEAFPARQREPFDDVIDREAVGEAATIVMLLGSQPIGLAVTSCLGSLNWSYLEYFAVAPHYHGRGIGHLLWNAMCEDLRARGLPRRVVLEIDDPSVTADGEPERRQHEKRLRFYERQGMRRLPVRGYAIPRMDGVAGSDPMLLLWTVTDGSEEPPDAAELRGLVSALYVMAYELPPDHPLVLAALRNSFP